MKVRVTLAALAAALLALVATGTATAQNQSGLVNVAVVNNTVQVPVGIAANVCGVSVDVLSQGILTGDTACQAVSDATATFAGGNGGSGGSQQGLVNLFVANNTIQVPVGLAANICGISAAVLAQFIHTGAAHCDAQGNGTATG